MVQKKGITAKLGGSIYLRAGARDAIGAIITLRRTPASL
jgi:hypothetical protein